MIKFGATKRWEQEGSTIDNDSITSRAPGQLDVPHTLTFEIGFYVLHGKIVSRTTTLYSNQNIYCIFRGYFAKITSYLGTTMVLSESLHITTQIVS